MLVTNNLYKAVIFIIVFTLMVTPAAAQKKTGKNKTKSQKTKHVLWEPVNISKRNLYLGPGGTKMRPNLKKITFIEKEKGGASLKFRIKDASNRVWVAKIGKEAQPETAAVRLIWALGYKSEVNYLVPTLTIPGKGTFKNVRLEARPENVDRKERWHWKDNPFNGTKELQGLKVMMALLNNWDIKVEGNNMTLLVEDKGRKELHYVVSDLGAAFGRTGYVSLPIIWRLGRSVNKPEQYSNTKLVSKAEDGKVKFKYAGRNPSVLNDITVEQTRWITNLLLKLSNKQIKDAFRAANYSPGEVETLVSAFKDKVAELDRATRINRAEK